jgi:UDP-arabinose 4-epimerase
MLISTSNILVTGGAGYIGSHVCKELSKNGYCPVTYDNLINGHKTAVKWGPLEKGDILDGDRLRQVLKQYKPSGVVHLAAYAYVGESVVNPGKYYVNNVCGTISLLEAMRSCGVNTIVFSSSCAIYGIPENIPISEKTIPNPVNPYGRSKLIIEKILHDYSDAYGLNFAALRYFNAAGADPEGETGERHNPETHLIPLLFESVIDENKEFKIFGNDYLTADGTCIRDYIHVSDLSSAHVMALKYLFQKDKYHFAINLGTGTGYSIMEMINVVEKITEKKINHSVSPHRVGDPPILVADPSYAMSLLSWKPQYSEIQKVVGHAWNFRLKLMK